MDFVELLGRVSTSFDDVVVQPLLQFFASLTQTEWLVVLSLLAGAITFGLLFGRAVAYRSLNKVFQNFGEALVSRIVLKNFGSPDYHLMNHVTLQMTDGTTQIDQILLSRFGIFVIETKDYKGWVFGGAQQRNWTQVLFKAKFKFQNPIHQNMRHVRAVQDLLDFLPPGAVKSVVVFAGDSEFKTRIPDGVFNISGLVDYIFDQDSQVISLEHLQRCVGQLEMARLAISGKTDLEHIQSLNQRHGAA